MRNHGSWTAPAIIMLALATVLSLSACGSEAKNANTDLGKGTGAVKDPASPQTVTFFSWVGNEPQMKKMAAEFHKKHPNITIKFENAPAEQAQQVLSTRIAGNTAPDVAYINASDTSDYAARGALVDLGNYMSRSEVVKPDDYVDGFRTFVTWNGKMWGLPFDGETTGLFYRTDRFKEAGIDGPPKTWDEFRAAAEKLTDVPNGKYGFEMFASEAAYYYYPWLHQAGGEPLTKDGKDIAFDSPAGRTAAAFYVDLAKYSPKDYLNSNSYDGRVAFAKGDVAMYVAGAWFAGTLADEYPKIEGKWAAAPLPEGAAGCKTTLAGDSLVMFNQTKVSDAAWLWMEFLSQPDNLAAWTYKTEGTLLPPTKSLLDGDDLAKEKPVLKPFADLMECGVASTVANPKYPRVETILNEELSKAIYGDQTAAEALDNAAQQGRAILARG
ncbi:ABC transporter substrate-binding protein [Nonomuraea sp. KC401]|uniref:ABC transporter substrate-binding protein n=1 Tax=unclassified Nonomuraea TaxID=2593643 RepID=UPI0010FEEB83|nr:ABC transporter substrate-binding protein [Nonomuraea sp. KC401]NBE93894.1 extracellular solute-binding protein [Nonomuraea sp. K271]TLF62105.1 ABC transporter substrate-binding protein [Nonomuraea sp. KC401]